MSTNKITITVSGPTKSGKTHVVAAIEDMLSCEGLTIRPNVIGLDIMSSAYKEIRERVEKYTISDLVSFVEIEIIEQTDTPKAAAKEVHIPNPFIEFDTEYVGALILKAKPMLRSEYCALRGWDLPKDENGDDEGFLLNQEGMPSNTTFAKGHISWQTVEQFKHFRPISKMSFGMASELIKAFKPMTRAGWNGKGMFVFMIQGSNDFAKLQGYGFGELMGEPSFRNAMFLRTADNQLVPWVATQSDILADDWMVHDSAYPMT